MRLREAKSYWQQDLTRQEKCRAFMTGILLSEGIAYIFYQSWVAAVLAVFPAGFYYKYWEKQWEEKQKEAFALQFKEVMQSMAAALNAGYSVENALKEAQKDLALQYEEGNRIMQELRYMIRQITMNLPIEQVFREFALRVKLEDVSSFVTVFTAIKRGGGDMTKILGNTVAQICEKAEVRRDIQTILAEKNMEFKVMTWIPFGMIAYMKVSFPEFMRVLYHNPAGAVFMTVCLALYGLAFYLGKKVIKIEV